MTAHDVVRAFRLLCNPVSPVAAPYYTSTIAGMTRYCDQFAQVPLTVSAMPTKLVSVASAPNTTGSV